MHRFIKSLSLLKVKNRVGVRKNPLIFTVNLQLGVPNKFIPSLIAIFKPFLQGVLKKFHQTFTFAGIYLSTFKGKKQSC